MTKSLVISAGIIGLFLTACGEPQSETVVKHEKKRKNVVLAEADIFETVKILAALQNEEKFLEEANQFFLKGLNAFRNNQDLDSADYYLKKSIVKEPSGKAYFELGNVYMNQKDYDAALQAFALAEHLDFQPFSKVLYNKACLYSLKEEDEMSAKYLEYALQAGYTNLNHIQKDGDLENLRESHHFKPALEKGLRGMSNADNLFWLQFKKQFPAHKMPHQLVSVMDYEKVDELPYISYEFEKYIAEMRDEKFSREVSKGFYHYAQAYETDDYVAVVYIVKEEFMGDYAPLLYRMATFTHDGKLIDKQNIGGREYLDDNLMEATLHKDKTIHIDVVKPTYEQDPDEHGYYDNKIVSKSKVGKMKYKVSSKGKINLIEGHEIKDLATN